MKKKKKGGREPSRVATWTICNQGGPTQVVVVGPLAKAAKKFLTGLVRAHSRPFLFLLQCLKFNAVKGATTIDRNVAGTPTGCPGKNTHRYHYDPIGPKWYHLYGMNCA